MNISKELKDEIKKRYLDFQPGKVTRIEDHPKAVQIVLKSFLKREVKRYVCFMNWLDSLDVID